jgi:hypothetical protein
MNPFRVMLGVIPGLGAVQMILRRLFLKGHGGGFEVWASKTSRRLT